MPVIGEYGNAYPIQNASEYLSVSIGITTLTCYQVYLKCYSITCRLLRGDMTANLKTWSKWTMYTNVCRRRGVPFSEIALLRILNEKGSIETENVDMNFRYSSREFAFQQIWLRSWKIASDWFMPTVEPIQLEYIVAYVCIRFVSKFSRHSLLLNSFMETFQAEALQRRRCLEWWFCHPGVYFQPYSADVYSIILCTRLIYSVA